MESTITNWSRVYEATTLQIQRSIAALEILRPAIDLILRLWLARVFWNAGTVKLMSWNTTLMLFANEYNVPLLDPTLAAWLATGVEVGGAVLLAIGFGTRIGALALSVLNAVAVYSYYSELSEAGIKDHIYWGMMLGVILLHGPGTWSVDFWIRRRFLTMAPRS